MNITITDDNALEWNQDFTLSLTSTDTDVLHGQNITVITIVDNDGTFGYPYILTCFKLVWLVCFM